MKKNIMSIWGDMRKGEEKSNMRSNPLFNSMIPREGRAEIGESIPLEGLHDIGNTRYSSCDRPDSLPRDEGKFVGTARLAHHELGYTNYGKFNFNKAEKKELPAKILVLKTNNMHKTASNWNKSAIRSHHQISSFLKKKSIDRTNSPRILECNGKQIITPILPLHSCLPWAASVSHAREVHTRMLSDKSLPRKNQFEFPETKNSEKNNGLELERISDRETIRKFNWEGIHFEVNPKREPSYESEKPLQDYSKDMNLVHYNFRREQEELSSYSPRQLQNPRPIPNTERTGCNALANPNFSLDRQNHKANRRKLEERISSPLQKAGLGFLKSKSLQKHLTQKRKNISGIPCDESSKAANDEAMMKKFRDKIMNFKSQIQDFIDEHSSEDEQQLLLGSSRLEYSFLQQKILIAEQQQNQQQIEQYKKAFNQYSKYSLSVL